MISKLRSKTDFIKINTKSELYIIPKLENILTDDKCSENLLVASTDVRSVTTSSSTTFDPSAFLDEISALECFHIKISHKMT